MGLQWSTNLPSTLRLFSLYLAQNGIMIFSLPIDNTFQELRHDYKNTNYRHNEITSLVEQQGLKVIKMAKIQHIQSFNSAIDAIQSIKAVGANSANFNRNSIKSLLTRSSIEKMFKNNHKFTLSYDIGIFLCKK